MRFLRHSLWVRFHLWTLGFVAVLTALNVSTQVRPYGSSSLATSGGSLQLVESALNATGRMPASAGQTPPLGNARALKLASLGCETEFRLFVAADVKQLRLKFEDCPVNANAVDSVIQVSNTTNGFEATVFSGESVALSPQGETGKPEPDVPGVFVTPEKSRKPASQRLSKSSGDPASTDYISLAEGTNEIRIQRSDRQQTLHILRK